MCSKMYSPWLIETMLCKKLRVVYSHKKHTLYSIGRLRSLEKMPPKYAILSTVLSKIVALLVLIQPHDVTIVYQGYIIIASDNTASQLSECSLACTAHPVVCVLA